MSTLADIDVDDDSPRLNGVHNTHHIRGKNIEQNSLDEHIVSDSEDSNYSSNYYSINNSESQTKSNDNEVLTNGSSLSLGCVSEERLSDAVVDDLLLNHNDFADKVYSNSTEVLQSSPTLEDIGYCDDEESNASLDGSVIENNEASRLDQSLSPVIDQQFELPVVETLPETVTVLDAPNGAKVYLVGTAHFSEKSQHDVSVTIRKTRPNVVVLELCESRLSILSLDERTIMEESKTMGIAKMRRNIQEYGLVQGVMYMLLLSLSAHLTKELGMAPGGEFRRAFHEANRVAGCVVHLGDRPVHITLRRAISSLSVWQKFKLAFGILFNTESISKEEVEKCKQRDLLEEMLAEMTGEFPALSNVFVHERDTYLAYSLWLAASPIPNVRSHVGITPTIVVGVVGIGHVPGIVKQWGKVRDEDIPPLLKLPEPSLTSILIRKSVKYSVIGLAMWGCYKLLIPSSVNNALSHASIQTIDWLHKSIKS